MIISDYHLHTRFSADSNTPPEDMVRGAIALGLTEIAITDHLDYPHKPLVQYPRTDLDGYVRAVLELADRYRSRIKIRLGLELGVTKETAAAARAVTDKYPFDFIICSTHDIGGIPLYQGAFFEGKPKKTAYLAYFNEVLAIIKSKPDFCVYGHLDYLERYGIYDDNSVDYYDYAEAVDAIFMALISQGKGLDVNASGIRYGFGHSHPQPSFLKRYKELGGEILTIGSDAHKPANITAGFKETREALLALGFTRYTVYKGKKPVFIPL